MPVGSGTQQQHEHAHDASCCLLSRCVFLGLALLCSGYFHACCLPLRMETRHDPNPDAIFGNDFIRNWTPISGQEPSQKRYPKWTPEMSPVSSLQQLQTGFAIRKMFFFGFRNGVVSDGLNAAIKRSMFGILSGTWCDLRVKPVKAPPKRGRTYIGVMWGIRFKSPSEKAILLLSKVGYHVQ